MHLIFCKLCFFRECLFYLFLIILCFFYTIITLHFLRRFPLVQPGPAPNHRDGCFFVAVLFDWSGHLGHELELLFVEILLVNLLFCNVAFELNVLQNLVVSAK